MKKLLLFVFLSVFSLSASAQHEADRWYFGTTAGLDFSSGSPVVVSSTMSTAEGCSTISNAAGQLLFYTDGISVWDSTKTVMPNGSGLTGDISSTQAALIVPNPTGNLQYYIFTTDADGGPDGFRYSIVDMTLGAHGDVIAATKNTLLTDSTTEKIAAVKDNANGYWIVIHKWGSDSFYAYHLISAGLQPPVISHAGMVHTTSAIQNTYGQMKFNMCGDRLALAIGYQNTVEVFDFDKGTGTVSNPLTLSMPDHVYGVEFSKSAQLLYITCYDVSAKLSQFDISRPTLPLILASKTPLSITDDLYGLQMGPDGKIYLSRSFGSSFLGVINEPDTAGTGCNYVENGLDIDPGFMGVNAGLTLPGFMQSYLKTATGATCPVSTGIQQLASKDVLAVYPNPSSTEFTIDLSASAVPAQLRVYDPAGRLVEAYAGISTVFSFGKAYAKGIYLVTVQEGNEIRNYKVVKM